MDRALGLARMLCLLMPDEPEVRGLLALLLLTDARRATRCAPDGRLLLLEEQDRSQWDRPAIDEGTALVRAALRAAARAGSRCRPRSRPCTRRRPATATPTGGRSCACTTCSAGPGPRPWSRSTGRSRWPWPTGPRPAWRELADLERDGRLAGYRYLPAAKADLLRRLGRADEAAEAYRAALELTANHAERQFLARRLAEVRGD